MNETFPGVLDIHGNLKEGYSFLEKFSLSNYEESGLTERFNEICKNYGKDLTLMFEPGKFLVSEAGKFLCKVNSIKQTTSTVFAQVDSGFNHFLRPMMYGANHHIENISNPIDSIFSLFYITIIKTINIYFT